MSIPFDIYTIAELQELLRMSHTTVTKLLYELDSVHGIGLIERYRQGNNRPSVIYVKNFVKTTRKASKILCFWNARNWKSRTCKELEIRCRKLEVRNAKIEVRTARIWMEVILR